MKKSDFRRKDDPAIWSNVPRKADDAIEYLHQKLIEENPVIGKLTDKNGCAPFDEEVRKKLRPAQEILTLIYRFDSEIMCGAVAQFCWNSPFEMEGVEKAIKKLGQSDLLKLYDKLEDSLNAKEVEWAELWNKGHSIPGVGVECFCKFRALLNLRWFDRDYLTKHRTKLIKALIDFVIRNKREFVK